MPEGKKTASIGSVAIAALVGGVAGAFVGLMVSPKSGEALRKDIQTKAGNLAEQVQDCTVQQTEALKETGSNLLDKGKKIKEDLQVLWQDLKPKKLNSIDIARSSAVDIQVDSESESEAEDVTFSSESPTVETSIQDDIDTLP
ncbi:YtxH domain-containing protein [Desulfosporosinus sp. FKA]|uniref:YtxH domain-containing protein n=1 Tax=Desulfosporosinus sp. FKA TaxID=1969834 RepID=UPI000B4A047B|nr:YtxH domain-containing protein [Desulfosporosinus sp. FKA]